MKPVFRRFLVSVQIGALIALAPTASLAEDDVSPFAKAFDVTVLRSLGLIKLAVGMTTLVPVTLLFTLKQPISPDASVYREATEILVIEPANYVFRRPLGQDLSGE